MRKRILYGATVAALAFLGLAVPALAQQGEDYGPRPENPMAGVQIGEPDAPRARQVVIQFLGLTPDQVTAWDALLEARQAAVEPLREDLQAAEKALYDLLQGANPDPAAVGTLVLKAKALREQMAAANKVYIDGFDALLTTEQMSKLGFLRRAERAAPVFPAFRLFGLLPLQAGGPGPLR
jgi:Spy/CpxP family protein refolding chaperone